jgi:oxygen-independent coproporphyrinogen-3 oxidase
MIAPAHGIPSAPTVVPNRAELLRLMKEHARPVPRYTSYPTVPFWDKEFGDADYREALVEARDHAGEPLSVYVHLPFCAKRCYYCGCNAMVTHRDEVVDRYLDHVEREIEVVTGLMGRGRPVTQLHWGGGTPNFLSEAQTARVVGLLDDAFTLAPGAEVGIEMDPRIATPEQPRYLKRLGFNRMSMGVQDFDPRVQASIGRIQPEEMTVELLENARAAGFESVNFDLVYGLPYQTPESFRRTIDRVVELSPDRIAAFSYAHLPDLRKNQRAVDDSGLPDDATKLGIFLDAVETLGEAGYEWIGFDHFARPDDELAVAARERRLLRNFMGYTTRVAPDQVGFGVSAIGCLAGRFVQNDTGLARYQDALAADRLPVVRGHTLTHEDALRSAVIQHLMCNLEIPQDLTLEEFGGTVEELLPQAPERFQAYEEAGFLDRRADRGWEVRTMGRFFMRNVASELDAYLRASRELPVFSSSV